MKWLLFILIALASVFFIGPALLMVLLLAIMYDLEKTKQKLEDEKT